MDTSDLLNIRHSLDLEIPLPYDSEGHIYVLGDLQTLHDSVYSTASILNGMDKEMTFYPYDLYVLEVPQPKVEEVGFNIVCVIRNPISGLKEYITASADIPLLNMAVPFIVNEAEDALKTYYREALIINALRYPSDFREILDKVVRKDHNWNPIPPSDDGIYRQAALGDKERKEHYLRNLSAKERKSLFMKMPDKLPASLENQDPETALFIKETLENITPEEYMAICEGLFARHKKLLQEVMYTMIGGASKYGLIVKKRPISKSQFYRDKAQYELYLKDAKGNEIPVKFKHSPSYCIYFMHIIDRFNKKENARVIDLRKHREEFCKVYHTIYDKRMDEIEKVYDKLEHRPQKEKGSDKSRSGRYQTYIKDIHETFEKLIGIENSIPFKVGYNRFLSLHPSQISIPEDLTKLKIS